MPKSGLRPNGWRRLWLLAVISRESDEFVKNLEPVASSRTAILRSQRLGQFLACCARRTVRRIAIYVSQ